jgi:hypothetical protein
MVMRDSRYIAKHRGGSLEKEQHRQLIKWSCECVKHVLPLVAEPTDERFTRAFLIAEGWANGTATVGDARKASLGAINTARESTDPVTIAVARAMGHAVATAHMADHSLGGALYALKAVKLAGKSVEAERKWQNDQLPIEISDLILSSRTIKEKAFKLL